MNFTEEDIRRIQAKKYISVKEFTVIYGYSSEWQRKRRGKLHNRLPFREEKKGGKILYNVEEVEIWFKNSFQFKQVSCKNVSLCCIRVCQI